MGDEHKPYFLVEGRGLVRFISLVIAVFAAFPVIDRVSDVWNNGMRYAFHGDWKEVVEVIGMLILMLIAGSVALKGKFSIP
ncbi:MAG TPA: hypothetical protein VFC86_10720 [Planctomycetota bacterium]|nr:hypothetical protein [Planctomycetota bacterium]